MTTGAVRSPERPSSPLPRRRRLLTAITVVVVLALAATAWKWRHADVFREDVSDQESTSATVRPGETLNIRMTWEAPGTTPKTVTIHRAEPVIDSDTTAAKIEFWVCTARPTHPFANALGELRRYCSDLKPAVDSSFAVRMTPPQFVTMSVTPTQPGTARIRGMHLSYSDGWQSGTQTIGEHVLLRAR